MTRPISRPPADLNSFLGRKWLESLTNQSGDVSSVTDLSFILLAISSLLPNARQLVVSSNLSLADGGAGGSLTLSLNLNNANTWLQDQSVPDEAYGAPWNGSMEVPTKNAVYDKIETVVAGIPQSPSLLRNMLFGG